MVVRPTERDVERDAAQVGLGDVEQLLVHPRIFESPNHEWIGIFKVGTHPCVGTLGFPLTVNFQVPHIAVRVTGGASDWARV